MNLRVADRIRSCRNEICNWKKNFELNAKRKNLKLHNELETEESSSSPCRNTVLSLKWEFVKANRDEESFWKQRSKDRWLKCGDRNTKAFHASVQIARSRNGVDVLEDKNGWNHRGDLQKAKLL